MQMKLQVQMTLPEKLFFVSFFVSLKSLFIIFKEKTAPSLKNYSKLK